MQATKSFRIPWDGFEFGASESLLVLCRPDRGDNEKLVEILAGSQLLSGGRRLFVIRSITICK